MMKQIEGFPEYSIDRNGNVYRSGRTKKAVLGRNGYFKVSLWHKNKQCHKYIHRLLLEAFVGPCPNGCEALHINGDRIDNRLENLRWGTRLENVADMVRHGTAKIGSRNSRAVLTAHDVLFMRDMKQMGFTYREIERHFPASQVTIIRAVTGQTYKDVANGL